MSIVLAFKKFTMSERDRGKNTHKKTTVIVSITGVMVKTIHIRKLFKNKERNILKDEREHYLASHSVLGSGACSH